MLKALVVCIKFTFLTTVLLKVRKNVQFLTAHMGLVAADLETYGLLSAILVFIS